MDDDERRDIAAGRAERWQDADREMPEPVAYYWAAYSGTTLKGWTPIGGSGRFSTDELDELHGHDGWIAVDPPEEADE